MGRLVNRSDFNLNHRITLWSYRARDIYKWHPSCEFSNPALALGYLGDMTNKLQAEKKNLLTRSATSKQSIDRNRKIECQHKYNTQTEQQCRPRGSQ